MQSLLWARWLYDELQRTSVLLECHYQCNVSYVLQIAHHKHSCSTETRYHYDKLGFSCHSWHPLWCLLDKKYLVPAESVDYLTKVALQCVWHRRVGCSLFFLLLSILCYSSFLSFSFYLSESLLIWNKTPFCLCSKSFYLQKGMAPFD